MTDTRVARGRWQRGIWRELRSGATITNPTRDVRGRAASYSGRYNDSFRTMLGRARAQGYLVRRLPGVRGGAWGATYTLTNADMIEGRY